MTVYGIFGDTDASAKLVKAALTDQLEAHLQFTPDEDFWLCVGVRKPPLPIYETIIGWALDQETYVEVIKNFDSPGWESSFDGGETEVAKWSTSDRFMLDVVERLFDEEGSNAKIYALLGDQEPTTDVRRALARAIDSGMEVRDLAEAGLTYVGVSDNPIQTHGSIHMANETMTITQAGELADEGDKEALEALIDTAAQYDIDPDDHTEKTWAEFAVLLDTAMEAAEVDQPEDGESEAPASTGKLTEDELSNMEVKELRHLAKQLGVEGHDKFRSAKLIEGILEAQGNGGDAPQRGASSRATTSDGGTISALLAKALRAAADALDA